MSSSYNRHPRLKRRTPSPPPSPPPSRREKGEKSSKHYHYNDESSSQSASTLRDSYPTALLVRNLSKTTSKPAGYGFVKYRNAEDAAEAKHHMNNQIICGHRITVVFSKEDAKRPEQMLAKDQNT